MHFRRLAAWLLGAWLAGSMFMDLVATQNFRSVDRLLTAPPAQIAEQIQKLGGHDTARVFLRYQASELNRAYFQNWERGQIALGLTLFLVMLFGAFPNRPMLLLALLMLGIVLLMHFYLTPEITRLGRTIDFIPPAASSPERSRFWKFHGAYSASELVKLGLGLGLTYVLLRRRRKSEPAQIDVVDKPDHSHVDG
jgi:hypothetical protein